MLGRMCVPMLVALLLSANALQAQAGPVPAAVTLPRATEDSAVAQWFRANAIPLATVRPASGSADLEPLRHIVGDAKLVLLGEATHGTREFFELKHRFIEYLASSAGFTRLITEGEWSGMRDAAAVLTSPSGRPDSALMALRWWNLTATPATALLAWVQRYNREAGGERLAIDGMDMQDPWRSAERLLAYLRIVDSSAASDLATAIRPLEGRARNFELVSAYSRLDSAVLARVRNGIDRARSRLLTEQVAYISRSSAYSWEDAVHEALVLHQGATLYATKGWPQGAGAMRDRFLAENVFAIAARTSGRAILWAHNAHVMRSQWAGRETLGGHLSRVLGSEMVVFGFAFNRGEFRAREPGSGAVATHAVGPAPEGSISAMLARVGLPLFMIDLRKAPKSGPVAEWLNRAHPERSVGGEYRADAELPAVSPGAAYDVLVFIDTTTWSN